METIIEEIFEQLETYFADDENYNESALLSIVTEKAYEVRSARKYPSTYTDDMIASDLSNYKSNIYIGSKLAYAKLGAEGETSHSENGTARNYANENAYLKGVVPLSVTC